VLTTIFDEKKADVRSGDEGDKEPADIGTAPRTRKEAGSTGISQRVVAAKGREYVTES
jgi:hypothetical protein